MRERDSILKSSLHKLLNYTCQFPFNYLKNGRWITYSLLLWIICMGMIMSCGWQLCVGGEAESHCSTEMCVIPELSQAQKPPACHKCGVHRMSLQTGAVTGAISLWEELNFFPHTFSWRIHIFPSRTRDLLQSPVAKVSCSKTGPTESGCKKMPFALEREDQKLRGRAISLVHS